MENKIKIEIETDDPRYAQEICKVMERYEIQSDI